MIVQIVKVAHMGWPLKKIMGEGFMKVQRSTEMNEREEFRIVTKLMGDVPVHVTEAQIEESPMMKMRIYHTEPLIKGISDQVLTAGVCSIPHNATTQERLRMGFFSKSYPYYVTEKNITGKREECFTFFVY